MVEHVEYFTYFEMVFYNIYLNFGAKKKFVPKYLNVRNCSSKNASGYKIK